ncbi:MAG: S-adenosylmethionine:tRNA ribosyltransferase-isomerase [Candidatus Eremiobacteraeota bacterium]|nr:S-adenosylmethionine:tRNA ribosyltransferase-isomerase [Candidatus Eremiobacteraeota bacterium]
MTAAVAVTPALLDAVAPPERRGVARDAVRMLVTDRRARVNRHARFYDMPSFLAAGDVVVVNDSATLPAAITARRSNGQSLKLHLSTMIGGDLWMVEPRGVVTAGETLQLAGDASAVMLAPADATRPRVWYASFRLPITMLAYLMKHGEPIRYQYLHERFPLEDYQTIFARQPGSSEMPSAARPFTARVVAALERRGVQIAAITLHCGVASFEKPEHPSIERFSVSHETARQVNSARAHGNRVIAVGTTSLRALETAWHDGEISASSGWTDLVFDERSAIRSVDGLLTGFHDEASTHESLLHAFLNKDLLSTAYVEAAECGYYQHEFGDAHLIL